MLLRLQHWPSASALMQVRNSWSVLADLTLEAPLLHGHQLEWCVFGLYSRVLLQHTPAIDTHAILCWPL